MHHIFKIGGNIVDSDTALNGFLAQVATLQQPAVLVHGGGKLATALATRLGLETRMVDGRRITDADTLQVAVMVYAGWVNKNIAARLTALGRPALGLAGADAGLYTAHRRTGAAIDYGYVGDVDAVNPALLLALGSQGITPVVAPVTAEASGQLLNTNADTMAGALAKAMAAAGPATLYYCFEKDGVLANPDDDTSALPSLTRSQAQAMVASGAASQGMMPKLENAFAAAEAGAVVWICHARHAAALAAGTLAPGTRILAG